MEIHFSMPNFRRYYLPNSFVFITSVTDNRIPYFEKLDNINLFFDTLNNVKSLYAFNLFAHVLLPDHFHWLLHIPDGVGNFSKIVQCFKRNFTLNYKKFNKIDISYTIWQRRFWDHVIRSEEDLQKHLDYIHWNPVKHQLTNNVFLYPYSSFQSYLNQGVYSEEWGNNGEPVSIKSYECE